MKALAIRPDACEELRQPRVRVEARLTSQHPRPTEPGDDHRLPVRRETRISLIPGRCAVIGEIERSWPGGRASQSLTVPSLLAVAKVVPSGETETPQILPVWPSSEPRSCPVAASQSFRCGGASPPRRSCGPRRGRPRPGCRRCALAYWNPSRHFTGGEVPDAHVTGDIARGEPGAIRREGQSIDSCWPDKEGLLEAQIRKVPELDVSISARRGQCLPIGREHDSSRSAFSLCLDCLQFLTRRQIPELDQTILAAAGDQTAAIRCESGVRHPLVSGDRRPEVAGRNVPEPDLAIVTGRDRECGRRRRTRPS